MHFHIVWDFVVEFELKNTFIGQIAKVECQRSQHAVDHNASVQVVAVQPTVGQDQLATLFNSDGGTSFHGDVRTDGKRGPVADGDMTVHGCIISPRFGFADVCRLASRRWCRLGKWCGQKEQNNGRLKQPSCGTHGPFRGDGRISVLPRWRCNQGSRRPYSMPMGPLRYEPSDRCCHRERGSGTCALPRSPGFTSGVSIALRTWECWNSQHRYQPRHPGFRRLVDAPLGGTWC